MKPHQNCSCPLCVPGKYAIRPFVAPQLPIKVIADPRMDPGSWAVIQGNTYPKDPRYDAIIAALAQQYPTVPLSEVISDLMKARGIE